VVEAADCATTVTTCRELPTDTGSGSFAPPDGRRAAEAEARAGGGAGDPAGTREAGADAAVVAEGLDPDGDAGECAGVRAAGRLVLGCVAGVG
jgi:hypothetical protein